MAASPEAPASPAEHRPPVSLTDWLRRRDDRELAVLFALRPDLALPAPADITFTATPADAQLLHDGALDLSVGFMRGQVKMAGDFAKLLRFLPLTGGVNPQVVVAALLPI